jgi:hypothetical protein
MKKLLISLTLFTALAGCDKLNNLTNSDHKQDYACALIVEKSIGNACVGQNLKVLLTTNDKTVRINSNDTCILPLLDASFALTLNSDSRLEYRAQGPALQSVNVIPMYLFGLEKANGQAVLSQWNEVSGVDPDYQFIANGICTPVKN